MRKSLQGEPASLIIGLQTSCHWVKYLLPPSSAVTTQYLRLLWGPLSPEYKLSPFNFLCPSSLGRQQHRLRGPSVGIELHTLLQEEVLSRV